ncbi:MAG: hypothetical protein MI863_11785 [Desulfobacterales bacterium]|nr:hypothetical protein [Desulfobacterales bacterium]
MKRLRYLILVIVAAAFVSGCFGSGAKDRLTPKTFGILNSFPDHPLYLKKKTLVAQHKTAGIESLSVKSQFTEVMTQHLEGKGYLVKVVDDRAALTSGEVDMLIEIVPRGVFKVEGMYAYGFADRKFLLGLVKQPARSYVAMQLSLRRANSSRVINTKRQERFSQLGMDVMPETWDELPEEDKEAFEANLRDNMAKALYLSLRELKI